MRALIRHTVLVAGVALPLGMMGVVAAASSAAAAPSGGSAPAGAATFTVQGESQFVVPAGVTSVTATVVGAQGLGADNTSSTGGLGAQAVGSLTVTPGQTLYVEVNVLGGPAPGEGTAGSAGGGESDVRACPAAGACSYGDGSTLDSRLLVAGGGGGNGSEGEAGGNAGTTGAAGNGADGTGQGVTGGGGATQSTFGLGGAGCGGGPGGSNGAAGTGGAGGGSSLSPGGGGGGGGWFGGGGGGACASSSGSGGGGGSSYADPSVAGATFSQAANGQAPSVTLSYAPPAPAGCSQAAGTTTCASLTDSNGNPIPNAAVTFRPASGPATNATTGSDGTASVDLAPGTYSVTMYYANGYQTKTLLVTATGPNTVNFTTVAVTPQISNPTAGASVAQAGNTGTFGPKTAVDGNGQVTFNVLPGTNYFTAWDGSAYTKQMLTIPPTPATQSPPPISVP